MKTSLEQLRAVIADVAALPAEASVTLPAAFVAGMAADVKEGQAACAQLDAYKLRVAQVMGEKPALRIVGGGEDDVIFPHDVEGGAA